MTLKNLKEALAQEAQAQAGSILSKAQAEASGILEAEKSRALSDRKSAQDLLEKSLLLHQQERLAWAHLEERRILAEAREDAIRASIDTLYSLLKAEKGNAYPGYLKRTLGKAIAAMGKGCIVHGTKKDAIRLKAIARVPMKADLPEGLGGLIAESADGKIRFNGTLEARMEMLHGELRKRVYEKLFGKGGMNATPPKHKTA